MTSVELLSSCGIIPSYASDGSSGVDVRSNSLDEIVIEPGCSALIPTGIRVAIPTGYELQVRPRSGLALKHQVTILNTPGTIDSDYRGDIGVILINHGNEPFTVESGMRIAQLVLCKVERIQWSITDSLNNTIRGEGGFGHTGTQ